MNVGLIGLVECTVLKRRFGVTKEMRAYERGVYGEEKKKLWSPSGLCRLTPEAPQQSRMTSEKEGLTSGKDRAIWDRCPIPRPSHPGVT